MASRRSALPRLPTGYCHIYDETGDCDQEAEADSPAAETEPAGVAPGCHPAGGPSAQRIRQHECEPEGKNRSRPNRHQATATMTVSATTTTSSPRR